MKLKNKISGEIKEFSLFDGKELQGGATLKSLAEEWEDMPEEPKENWYINEFGTPTKADFVGRETLYDKCRKNFGNYFLSREEAEKAVEKLKAWVRLKDKGLEVTEWSHGLYLDKTIVGRFRYEFPIDNKDDIEKDLDKFISEGGEE